MTHPKRGDLKVWWIPQIPMKPFYYPVNNIREAYILLDALAKYDIFQLENSIKPDFSNAGGLMEFDPDGVVEVTEDTIEECWGEWYSPIGYDIDHFLREEDGYTILMEEIKEDEINPH